HRLFVALADIASPFISSLKLTNLFFFVFAGKCTNAILFFSLCSKTIVPEGSSPTYRTVLASHCYSSAPRGGANYCKRPSRRPFVSAKRKADSSRSSEYRDAAGFGGE
ncbi:MAG: hypothetical protein AAF471_07315, partial [Myxococcota bacterium]